VTESDFMRERRERTDAELAQLEQMRDRQRACLVRLLQQRAFQLCLKDDLRAQAIIASRQRRRPRRAFG
jgi:hypothetical protein